MPRFGILYHKTSGNPGLNLRLTCRYILDPVPETLESIESIRKLAALAATKNVSTRVRVHRSSGVNVMITNFCEFRQFLPKNWRFSWQPSLWSNFCKKTVSTLNKNRQFFCQHILKIITSVPVRREFWTKFSNKAREIKKDLRQRPKFDSQKELHPSPMLYHMHYNNTYVR
jgi:hypothetical protein